MLNYLRLLQLTSVSSSGTLSARDRAELQAGAWGLAWCRRNPMRESLHVSSMRSRAFFFYGGKVTILAISYASNPAGGFVYHRLAFHPSSAVHVIELEFHTNVVIRHLTCFFHDDIAV